TKPSAAYNVAINNSFDAAMYCDLQLTKDGQGICRTDLRLDNSTDIETFYEDRKTSYLVNGNNISGCFSIDFTAEELINVSGELNGRNRHRIFLKNVNYYGCILYISSQAYTISLPILTVQLVPTRSPAFDYNFPLVAPEEIPEFNPAAIWLNVQFQRVTFGHWEKTYTYKPPQKLVEDAHAAGLEIFAADFANDEYAMSYNYSYDPIREYLQFVDNNHFAVDGFLTDFSVTATDSIACYAHINVNISSRAGNPLIISYNGASGDYPGCTNIAYQAAIRDGADYIDCSVQITKDGIPFCRESPDLLVGTTITSNSVFFPSRITKILAIQDSQGIFTFDLTWEEIQTLTPNTFSPFEKDGNLLRNPAQSNLGKYMNLTAFLDFAKNQANISVLINIENARAIASERKLDVTNATIYALDMAGYSNISDRIRIQSDDSAVLAHLQAK
ncbi:hypothetical protein KI387_010491, partial [Taxus chinensis]